jgi:hypothetical protein
MTKDELIAHMKTFFTQEGVPETEFDFEFVVKMMRLMQISYFKYGTLSDAYPWKFVAHKDIDARLAKYRETGNQWYLADVGNFAMIEAKHPDPDMKPFWGPNDAADSPGRVSADKGRLVQEDNEGNRVL